MLKGEVVSCMRRALEDPTDGAWMGLGHAQILKNRKVRSVMGWLLSFQLSDPGAGVCCAVSMMRRGWFVRLGMFLPKQSIGVKMRFTWHVWNASANRRLAGARVVPSLPARHRLPRARTAICLIEGD